MSDLHIGSIITGDAARDAIHIAVAPVVAAEHLIPGEHVGLVNGKATKSRESVGVVDPFLMVAAVRPGQTFWLFMYPNTITSLRHEWVHPAFPVVSVGANESERWIRAFAERVGLGYDDLMGGAASWIYSGDYLNRGGLLEGEFVPEEFWGHYEAVTGKPVEHARQQSFFTCSC